MEQRRKIILYFTLFVLGVYFLFAGLVKAQAFLVPLFTAMVLAFLMLPINDRLERWKWPRALATLASTLIILLVISAFMAVLFGQVRSFTEDWDDIQRQAREKLVELNQYLREHTPLEEDIRIDMLEEDDQEEPPGQEDEEQQQQDNQEEQNQQNQEQQQDEDNENGDDNENEEDAMQIGEQVFTTVSAVFGFLGNSLLVLVYVFFFIYFRSRFKIFILRFFPIEKREEVSQAIATASFVSRRYLAGRLFLMVILAGFYFAGLAISGLENAFFIALISAALSIIPILGNFVGLFIAIAVSLLTDGETGQIIGIIITFGVAQFIDTYILQPIILGGKLDVHPFFIILSVIAGLEIWGIMGMVLAIPIFAIVSEVCRHVPALNPFGYLFSNKDIAEPDEKEDESSDRQ